MDRSYEYNQNYYDWTIKCLEEDEKYEELAFFMLGVDLMIRQSELMNLTFDQFDFPFVNDIKIMKMPKDSLSDKKYDPKIISLNTVNAVNKIFVVGKTRLFDKSPIYYIDSIRQSNGDKNFNGHLMKGIGLSITLEKIAKSDC